MKAAHEPPSARHPSKSESLSTENKVFNVSEPLHFTYFTDVPRQSSSFISQSFKTLFVDGGSPILLDLRP